MYLVVFLLIVLVIALGFVFYMWKREAMRREDEHNRRQERFAQLIEQLSELSDKPE